MGAVEVVRRRSLRPRDSTLDENHEVVPRRPRRRKALMREEALAVQQIVDQGCLFVCFHHHDCVRLLRAPDGFQAQVGDSVAAALDPLWTNTGASAVNVDIRVHRYSSTRTTYQLGVSY